jgi:hypothetical protein
VSTSSAQGPPGIQFRLDRCFVTDFTPKRDMHAFGTGQCHGNSCGLGSRIKLETQIVQHGLGHKPILEPDRERSHFMDDCPASL